MSGELTVEANGTSLTVVGANQGRMGWCEPYDDRQFDTSEIPKAARGDTVSLTVKKTEECARPGEQWNTLGGPTAERFTVDLRNGPAFVDNDVDGVQDWVGGSGCYNPGGTFAGPVVHLGDFTVNKGGNDKTGATCRPTLRSKAPLTARSSASTTRTPSTTPGRAGCWPRCRSWSCSCLVGRCSTPASLAR